MNKVIQEARNKVAYISGTLEGHSIISLNDGDIELGLLYKEFSDKLQKVLDEITAKETEYLLKEF